MIIRKIDESFLELLNVEDSVLNSIKQLFSAYTPGYRYLYAYKTGKWDGKYYCVVGNRVPIGLLKELVAFLDENRIPYELDLKYHSRIRSVETDYLCNVAPHDYQKEAVEDALKDRKMCVELPTGSGKTLVEYLLVRILKNNNKKVLILVPRSNLVLQMQSDFESYGSLDLFVVKGRDKNSDARVYLTTWQSVYKLNHEYFKQFDAVIVDEAHNAKAKELNMLITKCSNAEIKVGFSGTFGKPKTHERLMQTSVLGPIKKYVDYERLKKMNQISEFKVIVFKLVYTMEDKKNMKHKCRGNYAKEVNYVNNNVKRNELLLNMLEVIKNNSIVLFSRKDTHGKILFEEAKKMINNKTLIYLDGDSSAEEREEFRNVMRDNDDVVGFVTFGIFSEGVSINNLHNVFLISSYKSRVKILQAIGRNLRTNDNKKIGKIFDIVDDFSHESIDKLSNSKDKFVNYSMIHMFQRVRLYKEMKIDFSVKEVTLK